MRGNYRTDITFAIGASALALFLAACNKPDKKESITQPTPAEKIQNIFYKMSGNKYSPFTAENKALAERIEGATLNMMIVDRSTGDQTNIIDTGTQVAVAATPPDIIEPTVAATPPDIIEPAAASKKEEPDVLKFDDGSVTCAHGKKCRRISKLNDRTMEKLSDPTKFELQVEVVYILKNPMTVISANGVVSTETALLNNREGSDASYQIFAGCATPKCKKIYVMLSRTDNGKTSQAAMIYDLNNERQEYTIAWAAHPTANDLKSVGPVRSAILVAKERNIKLDPNTQLVLRPEMKKAPETESKEKAPATPESPATGNENKPPKTQPSANNPGEATSGNPTTSIDLGLQEKPKPDSSKFDDEGVTL